MSRFVLSLVTFAACATLHPWSAQVHAQTPSEAAADPANPASDLPVTGDQEASPAAGSDDPWRAEFTAWIWLMGVEGETGAQGQTADVSDSFLEILDSSDSLFAFSGRFELGYRRVGAFVDAFYADIGVEDSVGPGGVPFDTTMEQFIVDFGAMFRAATWDGPAPTPHDPRDITLDFYAGGRYVDLDLELDGGAAGIAAAGRSWTDPIVGAKLVAPFAERCRLSVNGDVGGFGTESDFTWSATGVIGYDFQCFGVPASVYGGYRAIGWDYSDGSGATEFKWDVISHGPMLGFGLRF